MPRPKQKTIQFTIDGREVQAPENSMLVDAAKRGDVEIPVFCYEPKLGNPVGACRMCLVEVEGIPKLQTACSTAVKDGMVVITTMPSLTGVEHAVWSLGMPSISTRHMRQAPTGAPSFGS